MRFAGIRKFSVSGPAGVRSLGVRCRQRVQNGNNSIIEGLSGPKKAQTVYIKLTLNDRVTQVFETR